MRKKKLFIGCLLSLSCMTALGKGLQTLTINGQEVERVVARITFNGNNVVLHFDDGNSQECDMSTVQLGFNTVTSIDDVMVFRFNRVVGNELNISGISEGTPIAVYDVAGKLLISVTAAGDSEKVNIESLRKGVYVLKAGRNVVKFVKR